MSHQTVPNDFKNKLKVIAKRFEINIVFYKGE